MRLPLQKRLDTYTFIFLSARASAHIARFTKTCSIVPKRPDFVRLSCAISTSNAPPSTYRQNQFISEEVANRPYDFAVGISARRFSPATRPLDLRRMHNRSESWECFRA